MSNLSQTPHHVVQFYEDERFLYSTVSEHLARGLAAGDPAVLIAEPAHRDGVIADLRAAGIDPDRARDRGDFVVLDARETLARFMVRDRPNPTRFLRELGGVLTRARGARDRDAVVHTYGEMVNVLWREGKHDAAIAIEALWNTLADEHRFALLCGYAIGSFAKASHGEPFQAMCRHHTHVRPTETYMRAPDDDARVREIGRLQQRAWALEAEIAQGRELQNALRQALAEGERIEAERARLLVREQQARADAEEASRLKDEFLAVLSHELRTPLNAIVGWAQILTDGRLEPATVTHALEVIQRNAGLQLHMIDDLLDVSRVLTGRMRLNTSRVDLASALSAAIETVQPAADAKRIRLILAIDRDGTMPVVAADPDRLQQILWNLLTNAIKFTSQEGRVEVRVEAFDGHARIVVRDTGQGIAPSFLPYVFDRFRQEDTGTTRAYGGLGLGLAVVRHLVEAHGGTVSAASDGEGRGATFVMTLPLAVAQAAREDTERAADKKKGARSGAPVVT